MIEMKFSKNDEEDGLFRISSRDIGLDFIIVVVNKSVR